MCRVRMACDPLTVHGGARVALPNHCTDTGGLPDAVRNMKMGRARCFVRGP